MATKKPAPTPAPASPTPQLDALIATEPDLVDRIFDYVVELVPEIATRREEVKQAIRDEFAGERLYIAKRESGDRLGVRILALFNGRNASEVARSLRIGRATVYRKLKQAGRP